MCGACDGTQADVSATAVCANRQPTTRTRTILAATSLMKRDAGAAGAAGDAGDAPLPAASLTRFCPQPVPRPGLREIQGGKHSHGEYRLPYIAE